MRSSLGLQPAPNILRMHLLYTEYVFTTSWCFDGSKTDPYMHSLIWYCALRKRWSKFVVGLLYCFVLWHLSHCCKCLLICLSMLGHQYDWIIYSFIFKWPSCSYKMFPCTFIILPVIVFDVTTTVCWPPGLVILFQRISFSTKQLWDICYFWHLLCIFSLHWFFVEQII